MSDLQLFFTREYFLIFFLSRLSFNFRNMRRNKEYHFSDRSDENISLIFAPQHILFLSQYLEISIDYSLIKNLLSFKQFDTLN